MEKQKIIDLVGRHFSAEAIKKELLNLKILLSSTDCRISQNNVELRALEESIRSLERKVELQEYNAIRKANSTIEKIGKVYDFQIADIDAKITEIVQQREDTLFELYNNIAELEVKLDTANSKSESQISELKQSLEAANTKMYIFKNKEKELAEITRRIEEVEMAMREKQMILTVEIEKEKAEVSKTNQVATEKINEQEANKKAVNEQKSATKTGYYKEVTSLATITSHNISEFKYFDKKDLQELVASKEKLSASKEQHSQISSSLAETVADREEIIKRIALLDDKLVNVQKEREIVKEKVNETKETLSNQAKSVFGSLKTAMEMAAEYAQEEAKKEKSNPEPAEQTSTEENNEEPVSLFDVISDFVEEYANKQTKEKEEPTISDTLNDVFNIFMKRK